MDDEILEIFLEEGKERLANVARAVEGLAEAKDRTPLLDEIDRELHTLKGSARMLGYTALGRLVHETESLARALRKGGAVSRELLVEAADRIAALVVQCAKTAKDAGDEELEKRISAAAAAVRTGLTPREGTSTRSFHRSQIPRAPEPPPPGSAVAVPPGIVVPGAAVPAPPAPPVTSAPGRTPSLSDTGAIRRAPPPTVGEEPPPGFESLHPTKTGLWRVARKPPDPFPQEPAPPPAPPAAPTAAGVPPPAAGTDRPPELSSGVWKVGKAATRRVQRAELAQAEAKAAAQTPERKPEPAPAEPSKTGSQAAPVRPGPEHGEESDLVRVRASKLAQLDGLVSELSLARLRLDAFEESLRALASDLDARAADPPAAAAAVRRMVRRFREDRSHIARTAKGLERLAIDVRLRPVARVFDPLPREARELARRLGKKARVRIKGAETELDRAILDGVKDPLIHILRNTIDHGIEAPMERAAVGKLEEGQIDVEAAQDGGSVLIRVRDDGRGIDPEKVRAAAIKKRVLTEEQAARLTPEEAVELVFLPGFSTKEVVTDISGRGVGMDIVKKNVEALKGEVRVRSKVGEGTEVVIRLPLTALVSRVLFFKVNGVLMGVPTSAVDATAIVAAEDMGRFNGHPTVRHRGRGVPLAWLSDILGMARADDREAQSYKLVVVHHNDDVLALVVTAFDGERSVVVKPLGWPLERVHGTAGAVILGTGDLALLLHVPDLLDFSRDVQPVLPPVNGHAKAEDRVRRVLVVDDSVVTRQLEKRILEGLGFDVSVAVDGVDALRLLDRDVPDLIVTDVEMPRLDGLGLVRRLRKEQRSKNVPIVIVSTRGEDKDLQAGMEAGADGYIVKSAFDEKTLRSMIDRLL
jgi:two-component system chemotaxis sensor kinase CheA